MKFSLVNCGERWTPSIAYRNMVLYEANILLDENFYNWTFHAEYIYITLKFQHVETSELFDFSCFI